jgi:hypothetical protein
MKNPELLQICEKVIVNGVDTILLNKQGFSILLEAFTSFLTNENSSGEIIDILSTKLTKNIGQLSLK